MQKKKSVKIIDIDDNVQQILANYALEFVGNDETERINCTLSMILLMKSNFWPVLSYFQS